MFDWASYDKLRCDLHSDGVLEIVLSNPPANTVDAEGHRQLADIWLDVERDDRVRVALLRADGPFFSAGGDFSMLEEIILEPHARERTLSEARDLVRNIVECSKPIVSAINGVAVGAGLAAALLADISIAGRSAKIIDGHVRIGVAAGDHAVLIWPLLVGMAKAKYHLLTNDPMDGAEAERIGLVSKTVDDTELLAEALSVARSLASGSQSAIRWTKHSLNHWLRSAYPAFDAGLALEFMGWGLPDAAEGVAAAKAKRPPKFS